MVSGKLLLVNHEVHWTQNCTLVRSVFIKTLLLTWAYNARRIFWQLPAFSNLLPFSLAFIFFLSRICGLFNFFWVLFFRYLQCIISFLFFFAFLELFLFFYLFFSVFLNFFLSIFSFKLFIFIFLVVNFFWEIFFFVPFS